MVIVLVVMVVAGALGPAANPAVAQGTGDLLAAGTGARERTLAGGSAIADPAVALAWNPARLAAAGGLVAAAHLAPLPEGASLDAVGVAWPFGPGVLGAGITRVGIGEIATYDSGGIPTGIASFGDVELMAGYALGLAWPWGAGAANSLAPAPGIDLGLAVRLRRQSFAELAASGLGIDLGLAVRPRPGLELGARIRNLVAPSLTLADDAERLPRALAVGGALERSLAGRPFLIAVEGAMGEAETPIAVGFEVPVARSIVGRAGLAGSEPRLGLGVSAGFLEFDYGLETHALGLVHAVSITARLGEDANAKRRREVEARAAEREAMARAAAEEAMERTVEDLRARARSTADPEAARAAWLAVTVQRPEDPEARAAIAELDQRMAAARRDSLLADEESKEGRVVRLTALAEGRESEGEFADAAALWGQVLALEPGNPAAAEGLKRVRDELEAAAATLARTRRELGAQEADLARQMAEIARLGLLVRALEAHSAGEQVRAAATLDTLLVRYPEDPVVRALESQTAHSTALDDPAVRAEARRLYIEGMRCFNASDYEGAIRHWEDLLALDPHNPAVRLNLDEARARLGVEK
jgi:tetratricopeptide (TPR) repeat protein